jgi:hypothetical protein
MRDEFLIFVFGLISFTLSLQFTFPLSVPQVNFSKFDNKNIGRWDWHKPLKNFDFKGFAFWHNGLSFPKKVDSCKVNSHFHERYYSLNGCMGDLANNT